MNASMINRWGGAVLISALIMIFTAGCISCGRSSKVDADVEQSAAPVPQLVKQANGSEVLDVRGGQIPGMTIAEVQRRELPGVLEAIADIGYDPQSAEIGYDLAQEVEPQLIADFVGVSHFFFTCSEEALTKSATD